jgi:hypothetical protein
MEFSNRRATARILHQLPPKDLANYSFHALKQKLLFLGYGKNNRLTLACNRLLLSCNRLHASLAYFASQFISRRLTTSVT